MGDRRAFLAGGLVGATLATLVGLSAPPAYANPTEVRAPAEQFCAALTAADAAGVRGTVTDELWSRLAPSFAQGPAAGSFGSYQVLGAGLASPNLGKAYLSCRQPDGVEDVVIVTLRHTVQGWKVCGGPVGCTKGNPLGP